MSTNSLDLLIQALALSQRSVAAIHYGFHQVAQLLRGELIAFEVRGQLSLPIYDNSVKGVGHEAFVGPGIHAKPAAHLLDIRNRSRQKVPGSGIGFPGLGGGRQNFGLIVRRIEM